MLNPTLFAVAGKSAIKKLAVQNAIAQLGIYASVESVVNSQSGINEQPVGYLEIMKGVSHRVHTAYQADPRFEVYFGIENGIELIKKQWLDYAVVLAYMPSMPQDSQYIWLRSEPCCFPEVAVEATKQKTGGFAQHTVGKTLAEMGLVSQHDDPHLELCGKSRQVILQETCVKVVQLLPTEYRPSLIR